MALLTKANNTNKKIEIFLSCMFKISQSKKLTNIILFFQLNKPYAPKMMNMRLTHFDQLLNSGKPVCKHIDLQLI